MLFRPMQPGDADTIMAMSAVFYASDALSHPVPADITRHNLSVALSNNDILHGYTLIDDTTGEITGFAYLTQYYETEVGGICVQIIDLFIDPAHRGHGIATAFFQFIFRQYPEAHRFRLEVTRDNSTALALYRELGFSELTYRQMVIDRPQ